MELFRLLNTLEHEIVRGTTRREIRKVTNDSRKVEAEDVFVCVRGYQLDGHDKIPEAIEKGAGVIVVDDVFVQNEKYKSYLKPVLTKRKFVDTTIIAVPDTRYALAILSAAQYGYPAEKIKIIGITGTKGKSTVACMLHQILNCTGHKSGLIGTIQVDTGERIYKTPNTTPESLELQKYLKEMADAGCEYAVMEVSSQGLKLQRAAGISFEIGIFTNMGTDHIGPTEHADFEEYLSCKKKLFERCKAAVGNIDDPYYKDMFANVAYQKITYSVKNLEADYYAQCIEKVQTDQMLGSQYICKEAQKEYPVLLSVPGEFNVYNSLAVIAALRYLRLTERQIVDGLKKVSIPGRMEKVNDCMLYIDYAHNGMSLKSVLTTLRAYDPDRIIVVFGCGGNRARDRRYEMGEAAGKYADFTIITTDNPRYESPEHIIRDIEKGMKKTKGSYKIISDRQEAILYAIQNQQPGDVILIAGKGHETYQEIKGIRYEMDDRALVREALKRLE